MYVFLLQKYDLTYVSSCINVMATYLSRVDGQVSANQSYIILTVFKYNIPNIGVDF